MIIDIHAHPLFLEMLGEMPAPAESDDKSQVFDLISDPSVIGMAAGLTSKNYYGRGPNILSLVDFKDQMESAGIDMVALQVALIKGDPVRQINEQVAGLLSKFSGSFIGFAGFDPNTGEQAVADIEHAVKELGFKGIKTVSALMGLDINDKAYYPSYAKAQELGVPIMIHTGTGLILG
ncbi:MAG: amidohydrolase family protein, partial [Deltaproteobacteria bacterium]|nr:amidohydrolase family protein [Deltaproteobacteria bacterium]